MLEIKRSPTMAALSSRVSEEWWVGTSMGEVLEKILKRLRLHGCTTYIIRTMR